MSRNVIALAAPARAITYGTTTGTNYSNVGGLVAVSPINGELFVYCSGTLISGTVFLTAAHCGQAGFVGDTVCVSSTPVFVEGKSKLHCGEFVASPYYTHSQNDPNDIGVVIFD